MSSTPSDRFPWYEEIIDSDQVTQGDILLNCPIPIPNESVYRAAIGETDTSADPINIEQYDVVVVSQACDIKNSKIESIIVCPIEAFEEAQKRSDYLKSSQGIDNLAQGKEPPMHLLNSYESEQIKMSYSIVNFHYIFSLPKNYIRQIALSNTTRLRLLPPYREHLSQAFARYFMRVGLPLDIEKEKLKKKQQ